MYTENKKAKKNIVFATRPRRELIIPLLEEGTVIVDSPQLTLVLFYNVQKQFAFN
jgi:hypothetical protein